MPQLHQRHDTSRHAPQEGVSGGDENASPYYVPAAQRHSPPAREGSERANVLALFVGIFQYNNVLVPTVRRAARMRRHLASIHITYRYRQLYDVYGESAEGETSHVQFRRLDTSQESPCTGGLQYIIIIIPVHQTTSL